MKNKFIILLLGIMLIGFGSTWSEDEFNNSLATENLTFTGNENITRWLSVPENTLLTNTEMNLSGNLFYSNLVSYYKLNDSAIDSYGSNNGNAVGGIYGSGIINNGYIIDTDNSDKVTTPINIQTEHSLSFWIYIDNFGVANNAAIAGDSSGYYQIFASYETGGDQSDRDIIFVMENQTGGSANINTDDDRPLSVDTWYNLVFTCNSTAYCKIYINSTVVAEGDMDDLSTNSDGLRVGDGPSLETTLGTYDEVTYWTKELNQSEINDLYNSGNGLTYPFNFSTISLPYPTNSYIQINNTKVWNHTGEFNTTAQTNNFAQTINNYIETATAVAGYYLVPFIFHSDTAGILEYLSLIFNNDGFIENSQTYENSTFSGGVENFQLNITYDNNRYSNSQAYFYYNGDSYLATKTGSGSSLSFSKTLNIPIISTEINKTFHWQVELYDGTWEYYNSTFHNQTISLVYLGVCGGVSNDTLINMSLFDENTQTNITGNIQIDADITSKSTGEVIESLNTSFEDVQYGAICLSPVSSYNLYYLDMEIRYGSTGYASELYHIQKAELANATNLNLYDLNLSDSTEFKVTYQDDTFNFIEGAMVQLQRKYISEGVYKTVEAPLTSNEGVAILHIDLDTVKYRATVVKDGVVLDEFDNLVFKCQSELTGECEQKLLGEIDPQNNIDLDTTRDFSYSIDRTDNVITTSFTIPSGTPSSVNFQLVQKDQFGSSEMCNKTITSSAGSLQCTFNDTIGDSYIDLRIYKNAEPMAIQTYIIPEASSVDFLGNNYIIIVVLLLSIVGMALTSPEWIIINGIIVMVISGALWLASGLDFVMGLGSLMWLIIAAGILIFKLAKQEDR